MIKRKLLDGLNELNELKRLGEIIWNQMQSR